MAISTANLRTLLEETEEEHQLDDGFKTNSKKNNMSKQKNTINIEFLDAFEEQCALEEERNQRRTTKKKVVKRKKEDSEVKAPPSPIIQEKESPTVSNQMPVSSFSNPNKQQLRDAIIWAEVLGEPKCRKRHRR